MFEEGYLEVLIEFTKQQANRYLLAKNFKDDIQQSVSIAMAEMLIKQRKFFSNLRAQENQSKSVDEKTLERALSCFVPLLRLTKDKYLFGTEVKNLKLLSGKLVVRIGGGYDDFINCLSENAFMEVIRLSGKVKQG